MRVTFTDDAENQESLTSAPTETVGVSESHDRPHNLQATVTEGAITLTWQDPDTHPSRGWYHILRHRPELGEDQSLVYVEHTPSADRTFTDSAVEPGVLYVYAVKAVQDYFGSLGPASDPVEVRMPPGEGGEAPNSPATGQPTISGTVQVGERLTADTSAIADADGLGNAAYSYQWLADDSDIAGATGSTYTLDPGDEGKRVKVRVTFTDDAGNQESLTSVATGEVEARPNSPATGVPTVTGTAQVGETLTADTSGIADPDGLDNASFAYQWMADDSDIAGATDSTYTLDAGDKGKAIKVEVSFTDDAGNEESLTSAATDEVEARPNSPATGQPTISGTAQVGETLTADTSGIADADGLDNVSHSYQWTAGGSDIDGATGSAYTLTASEQGQTIQVRVSFTDDAGNGESLTSAATGAVAGPPAEPLTASLENTPQSHNGTDAFTFELRFSEEFGLSYKTLRDQAFVVTGGTVTRAQRLDKPSNMRWRITVVPDSNAAVTIILPATEDCGDDGAICTAEGEMLSTRLELTVSGPGQ